MIRELAASNVVTITQAGRRNTYRIDDDLEKHTVGP
jgi:hypothetical protein